MDCWHHEIDKANTVDEVVRSASDYLQLWAPREIDPMQLGLVDMHIDSPDDIERVKRWLADNEPKAVNPTHNAHLKELTGYFWHAASRVGQLRQAPAR
jgi:hypothetical protein